MSVAIQHAYPFAQQDVLTLMVGNQRLDGWQGVSVSRSMDQVPAQFDIAVTERYPGAPQVDIKPGQPCSVEIGGDLVLTGYVDRYQAEISGSTHTVRISGRSKSEDIVDCSALVDQNSPTPGGQALGGYTLSVAQKLAQPYGVQINSDVGNGVYLPQFNLILGETAWEVIDRIIRYSKLVCYDLPDGTMLMTRAGTGQMSSGFSIGQNVEAANIAFSMDQRFSDYEAFWMSTLNYSVDMGTYAPSIGPVVHDAQVPRFRKRYVVSEQTQLGHPIAHDRAVWECNRRAGRSQSLNLVCDSWRDAAGKLWDLNHRAPIQAEALKLTVDSWLIGAVTYIRDLSGQHAQIVMMPPEAFAPEPTVLQPMMPWTSDIEGTNNPAAVNPHVYG